MPQHRSEESAEDSVRKAAVPPRGTITVGIVDDDPNLRDALADLVNRADGLDLLGTAPDLANGFELYAQGPDVLLLDLALPDGSGLELLTRARNDERTTKIIVITVFGDVRTVVQAVEEGADGYLLKDASESELVTAIRTVLDGGAPLSPAVASHILGRLRGSKPVQPAHSLTAREVQVLEALAAGRSFKEVAAQHGISQHTVGDHVKSIYRKLAVNSRGEAVFTAARRGIIDIGTS